MKDRLIDLISYFGDGYQVENRRLYETKVIDIADYLLANGVIVPPCKVGDTVWVNWGLSETNKSTYPVKVYALRFDTKKNNMRICVEGHFKLTAYGGNYTHYYNGTFAWNSVGKTVFLTKEDAKKALAERSYR